jgi:hypothetical protein
VQGEQNECVVKECTQRIQPLAFQSSCQAQRFDQTGAGHDLHCHRITFFCSAQRAAVPLSKKQFLPELIIRLFRCLGDGLFDPPLCRLDVAIQRRTAARLPGAWLGRKLPAHALTLPACALGVTCGNAAQGKPRICL